jgi:hypothetical protein
MVNISKIVDDALARHGVEPSFDHQRLQWSRWFRCDSSFSVLLAPAKPGIFALAEEIISPQAAEDRPSLAQRLTDGSEGQPVSSPAGTTDSALTKRMLALLDIKETDDIGMALGRLFLPGNPVREKLETGKCFARYAVIEDAAERSAAYKIFERWLSDSANSYQDVA